MKGIEIILITLSTLKNHSLRIKIILQKILLDDWITGDSLFNEFFLSYRIPLYFQSNNKFQKWIKFWKKAPRITLLFSEVRVTVQSQATCDELLVCN